VIGFRQLAAGLALAAQLSLAPAALAQPAEEEAAPPPAAAETIPFRDDEMLARGLLARVLVVTVIGILIALAAVWVLRRFVYRGLPAGIDGSSIRLVAFRKLSPRLGVYVLEIDGVRFAVVESGGALVRLELPGKDDDHAPPG
jgi:hypothetical protein